MSTNILVESHNVSKNALKKAAKEKEKAEKKAQKQQEHPAKEEAADTARHLYGALDYQNPPPSSLFVENLRSLELNSRVTIEAEVETSRVQSAKLAFLVLRKKNQSIQVVVAEGGEQGISRQMVKFCGNLSNSFPVIRATGVVKAPKDAIKSTTISHLELHLESIYTITQAFEQRPVQVEDMSQPPPEEEESPPNAPKEGEESAPNAPNEGEESAQTDHSEGESPEEVSKKPNVSLKKRLDYKVITLQVPANEAIMNLLGEVYRLFHEYMFQHKFRPIFPSYLTGAATEGGAEVFEVKYFEREAFLTQSPQFHKQMAIAGRMQRVFTVGPVFRAENSNTTRHLTEFTGLDYEMTIRHHYHEVLSFGESLMIYIIRGLQTQEYAKELTNIIKEAGYPGAGTFKLPPGDKAVRITFAEAKSLLAEDGFPVGDNPHSDIE